MKIKFSSMKAKYCFLFLLMILSFEMKLLAQNASAPYPLIPYPTSLVERSGYFNLKASTVIYVDPFFEGSAHFLESYYLHLFGHCYKEIKSISGTHSSVIELRRSRLPMADEAYSLQINSRGIVIKAWTRRGLFYGLETLRQLLPENAEIPGNEQAEVRLHCLDIQDQPVFGWRGLHLDCARHFFSIGYLHHLIDMMAFYKLNKLHLHLTDDQGWRLEIRSFPLLTQKGAYRELNEQDSSCLKMAVDNPDMALPSSHLKIENGKLLYGGYYTQEDMKELVRYGRAHFVEIIPELDMPGHMMAAINAYPYLSGQGGSHWGKLFSTPLNPVSDSTYQFATKVYEEVMDIFPSSYIHLGADEVDRHAWLKNPAILSFMKAQNITTEQGLQEYFVHRMDRFFREYHRKMIGWDEILEGGADSSDVVMYWRDWIQDNVPLKAVMNGNHVIMSPGTPLYFNRLQDRYSLYDIYHFKVIPDAIPLGKRSLILGAQANLWAERVPSEARADYLYFPRMTALAERLWSLHLDYTSYLNRLRFHYGRLGKLGVHYRIADIDNIAQENVFTDSIFFSLKSPDEQTTLRYTTDGSSPDPYSAILPIPLLIKNPVNLRLAAFTPFGLRGDVYEAHFRKETMMSAVKSGPLKNGLKCYYYKKYYKNTLSIAPNDWDSSFSILGFTIPSSVNAPSFGLRYSGYIDVPVTGIYTFYLLCDDGGVFYIGDRKVVDNDGHHSAEEKSGQVPLQKGLHPIRLDFLEAGGGFKLGLKMRLPGQQSADVIPDTFLKSSN